MNKKAWFLIFYLFGAYVILLTITVLSVLETRSIINELETLREITRERREEAGESGKPRQYPTGYEIWDTVNMYRKEQGKQELILDKRYCNNIGARSLNYKETNSHDGLKEFNQTYIQSNTLTELLNYGQTATEIVSGWINSPSHNIPLLEAKRGCAYSDKGYSVLLLGY